MSDVTGILQFANGGITNKTKIEQQVSFENKTIMNINTSGKKLGNVTLPFPPSTHLVNDNISSFCICKELGSSLIVMPYSFFKCKHYNPPSSNTVEISYKFIFINYYNYGTFPLSFFYGSNFNITYPASSSMFKVNITRINGIFVAGQTLPSGNKVNKLCNLVIKKVSDHSNLSYFGRYDISLPTNILQNTVGYAILNVIISHSVVTIK